ncbi:hypothetical protein JCM19376_13290 [Fusibacter bizertensis]
MWNQYAELAGLFFPNATIIVDKYHFIRQVTWAIENIRKRVLKNMPADLRQAYRLKETFYQICQNRKYSEQRKDFYEWISYAKSQNIKEFKAFITAFRNWSKEILNAFKYRYTNGCTEGFNNKIKVLKRIGYGVRNFERFRNRILHICL